MEEIGYLLILHKMKIDKIFKNNDFRFIILDDNDQVIDDANGYGYKTYQNAEKRMWFKFKGGKEKLDIISKFWKENQHIYKYYIDLLEINCKEISRYEVTVKELIDDTNEYFNTKISYSYFKNI
jgi:hypothetical protein